MKREPSKFRNAGGQRWTRTLFYECQAEVGVEAPAFAIPPMYTLHSDREGLVNFQREYVRLGDPSGYQLAQLYLEDYNHWLLLLKSPWFRKAKEIWDVELDAKLSSEALATIRSYADGIEGVSPAVQLAAAKYLSDLSAKRSAKGSATRGRPSKEEVAGNLKAATISASELEGDLARIRAVR